MESCNILGVNINVTTMEAAVRYIDEHLPELKGRYICASNVHTTVTAYRDEKYREVQNHAALNLPDGKPLSVVQRKNGYQNAARVSGPDLMPEIFRVSEEKGYTHYFYGSTEATLKSLKESILDAFPSLAIAGMYSPPFRQLTEEEDREILERINGCSPDFIWVGLGAPKQELWMAAHEGKVCGLMLGVGAAFDFHAGVVKRAPVWMQENSLEWLFRMEQDPKRLLPRYLSTNFTFLYQVHRMRAEKKRADENKKASENRKAPENKRAPENKKRPERKRKTERKPGIRIAMLGHKRIPSREGGVEIVVNELARRMVRLGCEVDVYNRSVLFEKDHKGRPSGEYEGIRLLNIPTLRTGGMNAFLYSVFAAVRTVFGKYDIIHFHAEGPCIMIWLPGLFGRKTVATIHGLDWQRAKWGKAASWLIRLGEKSAAKNADEIIVLSRNMQKYFYDVYGRRVKYIPNGISRPPLREISEIRKRYGLEKDSYILFVARIVPEKGLHYLIRAFRLLDTEKRLVIAGGNGGSGQYLKQIVKMAGEDPRIVMTGHMEGRALEELYSNASFFVLPSDVEGMSISLLEAMSYGNCCVVSDIEENREVIGKHAALFKKGEVSSLRDVMQELVSFPEKRDRLRKESREFICSSFNWDRVAEETLSVYQGLLN